MNLDESIQVERNLGGKSKESKSKLTMLTSRCTRRTFCTTFFSFPEY